MAKISIKTDFKDGDKLPASDLNNNFKVIQEGVNANETNLESVIVEAEERLQKELEQITADRGWDWGGSSPDRATFYKNGTEQVNSKEIVNGQLLVDTETGEIFLDNAGKRISAGSGSVVQVGGEEPTNTATKIWFPSDTIDTKASEITNSMDGNETDLAPSVNTVKSYINERATYSTDEKVVGTWIDGKTLYRKVITLSDLRTDTYIQIEVASNALIKKYEGYIQRANGATLDGLPLSVRGSKKIEYKIDSVYSSNLTGAYVIAYYTKTTDEEVSE